MAIQKNTVIPNGDFVRNLRLSKGYTQENLALDTNCAKSTIERIEKGKPAQITTLAIIAQVLEVDVNTLLANGKEVVDLIHFQRIEDVLEIDNNKEAQWFRKSGPLVTDFINGCIYEHKKLLNQLQDIVISNNITILEGDKATGKTVLARNLAFRLINHKDEIKIYHYSCRKVQFDIAGMAKELNSLQGVIFIEDVHLKTRFIIEVLSQIKSNPDRHILLTARPPFRQNPFDDLYDVKSLPFMPLKAFYGVAHVIKEYCKQHSGNFEWTCEIKKAVKAISNGNFWLLAYAFEGCKELHGKGKIENWVKTGIDIELRRMETEGQNVEVLLALSPLYINEVETQESFLTEKFGFTFKDLNILVDYGEITRQEDSDGTVFYGLSQSSIAEAYWEHGKRYKKRLGLNDYKKFLYEYVSYGVSNGLTAILKQDKYDDFPDFLTEEELLEIVKKESNEYSCWRLANLVKDGLYVEFDMSVEFCQSLGDIFLQRKLFDGLELILHTIARKDITFYWEPARKEVLIGNRYNDDYLDVWLCLEQISECDEKVKLEICNLIDCDILTLTTMQSEDLREIARTIECIFRIDKKKGIQFWNKIDKNALTTILYNTDNYFYMNDFAFTLRDTYPKGLQEFIDKLSFDDLAKYLKETDTFMKLGFLASLNSVGSKNGKELLDLLKKEGS